MTYATKPVCFSCWNTYAPDKAIEPGDPRRENAGPEETCFGCGTPTHSGIYVRADLSRPFHLQRRDEGAQTQEKPCPMHVNTGNGNRYCEVGPAGHDGTHIGNREEGVYLRLLRAAMPQPLRATILAGGFDIEEVRDWSIVGNNWKVVIVKMPNRVRVDLVKEIN